MAVVKTRPAATAGEPMPSPRSADQRTFCVAENFKGSRLVDVEMPVQLGPRNWGQSSAAARPAPARTAAPTTSKPNHTPRRIAEPLGRTWTQAGRMTQLPGNRTNARRATGPGPGDVMILRVPVSIAETARL